MFIIDLMSRTPVYEQIIKQAEQHILTGILKAGDKMPSVRSLSLNLAVNPNTIQKAYAQLDTRGIIYTVPGKGSYVAENASEIIGADSRSRLEELREVLEKMKMAGVSKEEIQEMIDNIYKN